MPGPITADDLLSQVREQVDEQNTESVSDASIYKALNRAQRKAFNTLVKHYPDMFMAFTYITADAVSFDTYPIPPQFFGRRVNEVLVVRSFLEYPLKRVEYGDLHKFTSSAQVRLPSVYAVQGRNLIIKPQPQPGVQFKVWGPMAPETVVKTQGRITSVNAVGNYVVVDSLGSDVSTDVPSLGAFVNMVDCQTGAIKATMQVQTIAGEQVTFKAASPTLATVYGKTVAVALPSGNTTNPNANVNINDYLCMATGTCVPDLPEACVDYLVQYAVNEVKRRLGEPVGDDKQLLDELEADVEHQWAGRDPVARIRNTARHWTR